VPDIAGGDVAVILLTGGADWAAQKRRHVFAEAYGCAFALTLAAFALVPRRLAGFGRAGRRLLARCPGLTRRAFLLAARFMPFAWGGLRRPGVPAFGRPDRLGRAVATGRCAIVGRV
jgi:hypothetical protein